MRNPAIAPSLPKEWTPGSHDADHDRPDTQSRIVSVSLTPGHGRSETQLNDAGGSLDADHCRTEAPRRNVGVLLTPGQSADETQSGVAGDSLTSDHSSIDTHRHHVGGQHV